jgi:hypothetical protein
LPQATAEARQRVGATDLQPAGDLVDRPAEHAREHHRLAVGGRHAREAGMRRDQRGEPRSALRQRIRPAARVGDQDAPRHLGGGRVVRRDGAGGGIDTVHDGLEHACEPMRGRLLRHPPKG